jgi:hypothetical protein
MYDLEISFYCHGTGHFVPFGDLAPLRHTDTQTFSTPAANRGIPRDRSLDFHYFAVSAMGIRKLVSLTSRLFPKIAPAIFLQASMSFFTFGGDFATRYPVGQPQPQYHDAVFVKIAQRVTETLGISR